MNTMYTFNPQINAKKTHRINTSMRFGIYLICLVLGNILYIFLIISNLFNINILQILK